MSLYKKNCSVCQVSRNNPRLRVRIRYAAFKRVNGDETLADIAKEYSLNLAPMYNHAKKHITDNSDVQQARREVMTAKKVEIVRSEAQKELELSLDSDTVDGLESRPAEVMSLDDYLAQAADLIKKGELKITASTYLAAVKIRTEWASKQQGNKLEFLKTMAAFASGVKGKPNGTTGGTTESPDSGKDESSDIHRETSGDATPPWATRIPETHPVTE